MRTKFTSNLRLGSIELNKFQSLVQESCLQLLSSLTERFGLLNSYLSESSLSDEWKVNLGEAVLTIEISPGRAIIPNADGLPALVRIDSPSTISLAGYPDGTYKVLIKHRASNNEKGTVDLVNNSNVINGNGTEFTRIFGPNRRIIVGNAAYTVSSVVDDSELILTANYDGENQTGLSFRVGGWFTSNPPGLPDNIVYEYDEPEIFLKQSSKTSLEYWLAEITLSGGLITQITDRRGENIYRMYGNYPQLTGTPASYFTVGGRYVELTSEVPGLIKNLRISDVYGGGKRKYGSDDLIERSKIADFYDKGRINKLAVTLKFGYEGITGSGGSNSFSVNNPDLIFSGNELAGYYLYIPQISKNLRIISNLPTSGGETLLSVTEEDGTLFTGTGVMVTGGNPAFIHNNAETYHAVAIPFEAGKLIHQNAVEFFSTYSDNPVNTQLTLSLDIGTRYFIKARCGIKGNYTNYTDLNPGYFIKYGVQQNYDNPYFVEHPIISSVNAQIGTSTTRTGFEVRINGWEEAENFELAYTMSNAGATFSPAVSYPVFKVISEQRVIHIPTNVAANFHIAVRPLISGIQVAEPIYSQVVSGTSGNLPQDQQLISAYAEHTRYTVPVTSVISASGGTYIINFTGASTPNISGGEDLHPGSIPLPGNVVGEIFTDSLNHDFLIASVSSIGSFIVRNLNGNSFVPEGNSTGYIGKSERGRQILKVNKFPINYEIVRIDIDTDVVKGGKTVVRIYQESAKNLRKYITIEQSDMAVTTDLDLLLSDTYGDRNLIVDFYDDTNPANNLSSFSGRITVFGRPIADRGVTSA